MENSMPELKKEFAHTLRQLDFEAMPISRYNKDYISRIMKNIEYYIDIYDYCFRIFDESGINEKDQYTMVDYGGGHGFLSMYAQKRGIDHIIYVDKNPDSVHTAKYLKEVTGLGADVMICGDENDLIKYCDDNGITPTLLMGTDVIEHIYDIKKYFKTLMMQWPFLTHIYTTGSVPYNPKVCGRLNKVIVADEHGTGKKTGYLELRRRYIAEHYPEKSGEGAYTLAQLTRGMTYEDIDRYVNGEIEPFESEFYNTCDPSTGNWTERILTEKEYQSMVEQYGYSLFIDDGFYNTNGRGLKQCVAKMLNKRIDRNFGYSPITPFVVISMMQYKLREDDEDDLEVIRKKSEKELLIHVQKRSREWDMIVEMLSKAREENIKQKRNNR